MQQEPTPVHLKRSIGLPVFTPARLALAGLRWSAREHTKLYKLPWLPLLAAISCAAMLLVRLAMALRDLLST